MTRADRIASVERMQDELDGQRALVLRPIAHLSMGDRAEATETINAANACLGKRNGTLLRRCEHDGGQQ